MITDVAGSFHCTYDFLMALRYDYRRSYRRTIFGCKEYAGGGQEFNLLLALFLPRYLFQPISPRGERGCVFLPRGRS